MAGIVNDVLEELLKAFLTQVARHGGPQPESVQLTDKFAEGVRAYGLDERFDLERLRSVAQAAHSLVQSGQGQVALDLLNEGLGRDDGGRLYILILGLIGNPPAAGA